jgi:hypothetical protein
MFYPLVLTFNPNTGKPVSTDQMSMMGLAYKN